MKGIGILPEIFCRILVISFARTFFIVNMEMIMEHCLSTRCRIHCHHSYEEGSLKQYIIVVLEAMNLVPSRRWESFWRSHRATQGSQGFLNLAHQSSSEMSSRFEADGLRSIFREVSGEFGAGTDGFTECLKENASVILQFIRL